jgi:hypothetical protein
MKKLMKKNSFFEYYGDSWRDKIVTHRTPTGRITRVKVSSLPPEEQWKYNPNRFKKSNTKDKILPPQTLIKDIDDVKTISVYVGTDDVDNIKNLESGQLILGTTESKYVLKYFDENINVVKLSNVPVKSIKGYIKTDINSVDFLEDFEVVDIEKNMDEEQLFELANFSEYKIFMLDITPYIEFIRIDVDTPESDEDDFEELKNESSLLECLQSKLLIDEKEEFRDAHVAPSSDFRPVEEKIEDHGDFSLDEVARGYHNQPSDYFDEKTGPRDYMYRDKTGMESFVAINNIIRAVKNNINNRTITAYRAVPNSIKNDKLINGDWVTFSKSSAISHGEHRFGEGEYKIIDQEVLPSEVWWDGNDIREWGYDNSK